MKSIPYGSRLFTVKEPNPDEQALIELLVGDRLLDPATLSFIPGQPSCGVPPGTKVRASHLGVEVEVYVADDWTIAIRDAGEYVPRHRAEPTSSKENS